MKFYVTFVLKTFGIFLIFNTNCCVLAKTVSKRGVMDNLNDGLKLAGQMFGINTAADVANLVAKAFSATASRKKPDIMSIFQRHNRDEENQEQNAQQQTYQDASQVQADYNNNNEQHADQSVRNGEAIPAETLPQGGFNSVSLITGILKMIGFDAGKLGALAINALIMVAQAIGSTLMSNTAFNRKRVVSTVEDDRYSASNDADEANKESAASHEANRDDAHQPRSARSGNPIDWFLDNPNKEMRELLGDVTDVKLSDRLTNMIEKLESEAGQGACIKMLMCKSSPFIWGMQKSLAKRFNNDTVIEQQEFTEDEEMQNFLSTKGFFTHLPSIQEFRQHGEKCEKLYSNFCNTTNLYKR